MTTLQEYLNNLENKEQIKEINLTNINQEREQQGITELLEGGEIDLREFKSLEEVKITENCLKSPLTKIEVDGLTNLKELILPSQPKEESEEEKKLWEELGIVEKSAENTSRKKVIQEVKRLSDLFATNQLVTEKLKVHFATEKAPQEPLGDQEAFLEQKDDEYHIYLQLARKDKQGNFDPSLIFWTLARELTLIKYEDYSKDPSFWNNFYQQLVWVKKNISEDYQKEFELLLNPSTFPSERLEIKELLAVYFPNAEPKGEFSSKITKVNQEVVDETWQTIKENLIKLTLTAQGNLPEEQLAELVSQATINYNSEEKEYTIEVIYSPAGSFSKLEELIIATPLKLEIEYLKQKQEQLPTTENFTKLTKERIELKSYLKDLTDEEEFNRMEEKISKIE